MKWNYLRMMEILNKAITVNNRVLDNIPYYEKTEAEVTMRAYQVKDYAISLPRRFHNFNDKMEARSKRTFA